MRRSPGEPGQFKFSDDILDAWQNAVFIFASFFSRLIPLMIGSGAVEEKQ
jgi:hypothetical protein